VYVIQVVRENIAFNGIFSVIPTNNSIKGDFFPDNLYTASMLGFKKIIPQMKYWKYQEFDSCSPNEQ